MNVLSAREPAHIELDWKEGGNQFKLVGYVKDVKIESKFPEDDYDILSVYWGPQTVTLEAQFTAVNEELYSILIGESNEDGKGVYWSKHYTKEA